MSFSSTAERVWICPYCGEDITGEAAKPAETKNVLKETQAEHEEETIYQGDNFKEKEENEDQ